MKNPNGWLLADLKKVKKNGLKVFSCFHCGGGSSMGYKLAGFEVLGGVEIDPKMMEIYRANHKPKHSFLMGVQDFAKLPNEEIPAELFGIDVLDGSPPCSSFSMSGAREDQWGKEKKFREGQAEQVLDNLFFDFIDIAKRLQPKVVVAENVKGLISGKARFYVKKIFQAFDDAGYDAQLFLLNASRMGVPQRRERTFFIARRKNLGLPKIKLEFNEKPISFEEAVAGTSKAGAVTKSNTLTKWWDIVEPGLRIADFHPKKHLWEQRKVHPDHPVCTVTATTVPFHHAEKRHLSPAEIIRCQTFPDDFDFRGQKVGYVCGMSVPPRMMERVAAAIRDQLLS